jgi:hypothetical protein
MYQKKNRELSPAFVAYVKGGNRLYEANNRLLFKPVNKNKSDIPSVHNCLMFDFFNTNFDHSYYSKYLKIKYNMIYYIMYFKYIFEFFSYFE